MKKKGEEPSLTKPFQRASRFALSVIGGFMRFTDFRRLKKKEGGTGKQLKKEKEKDMVGSWRRH